MADAMATALLSGVVRAGGSRQVVAATAVALWRACRADADGAPVEKKKEIDAEVEARVQRIRPVLRTKVEAAVQGKQPYVAGGTKTQRNVAEHAMFGEGAEALPKTEQEAKRRQRGRRKKAAKEDTTAHSELEGMAGQTGGKDAEFDMSEADVKNEEEKEEMLQAMDPDVQKMIDNLDRVTRKIEVGDFTS